MIQCVQFNCFIRLLEIFPLQVQQSLFQLLIFKQSRLQKRLYLRCQYEFTDLQFTFYASLCKKCWLKKSFLSLISHITQLINRSIIIQTRKPQKLRIPSNLNRMMFGMKINKILRQSVSKINYYKIQPPKIKQQITNPKHQMSTNSNEMDELMQQSHAKQTKLQKFLRTLDDHTMKQINMYLQQNQPNRDDNAPKLDKIKLYEDLLIIQVFKAHEKNIGNKKKIQQLCQVLKNQTQFSAATIRERIQKKLANVSKQQILDHIRLNINFTFNTKRKLMPVRSSNPNGTSTVKAGEQSDDIYDSSELSLNDNQRQNKSKQSKKPKQSQLVQQKSSKQSKIISINSSIQSDHHPQQSAQQSGNSVKQIPQSQQKPTSKSKSKLKAQSIVNYTHNNVKSLKRCVPRDQVLKCNNNNNTSNITNGNNKVNSSNRLEEEYNQFRQGSDHESDDDIIFVPEGNNQYRVSTRQAEVQLQWIINNVKQEYINMRDNPQQPSQQQQQVQQQQQSQVQSQSHNKNNRNEPEVKVDQASEMPKVQQKVQHNHNHNNQQNEQRRENTNTKIPQNNKKQPIVPPPQQLHQFCSIQEWEAAHQNPTAHQHLRWYSDQDQFLKNMICNGNVQQAISALQVVKKYKSASNVIRRLKYLNMEIPTYIMNDLHASS